MVSESRRELVKKNRKRSKFLSFRLRVIVSVCHGESSFTGLAGIDDIGGQIDSKVPVDPKSLKLYVSLVDT